MALIEWSSKFSVGIAEIDEQHKKLFEMINNLDEAMIQQKASQALSKTLDAMIDYTVEHFSNEERYMEEAGYSELEEHRKEHNEFTLKAKRLRDDYMAGKDIYSLNVMNILKDWLSNHILFMDRRYIPYLNKK